MRDGDGDGVRGITLEVLARELGGRRVLGDAQLKVTGVATLEAGGANALGFVRDAHASLAQSKIGAVIAPLTGDFTGDGTRAVLRSPNPSLDFARAARLLHPQQRAPAGVHARAFVAESAQLGAGVSVGVLASVGERTRIGARTELRANVVVERDVEIGADCVLHIGALVREGTRLGDRVILQPGAILGGDGFGYEFDEEGRHEKVPQLGRVELDDDVEVGAGATIDRARIGATRIGRGVKIDNLVQVGHGATIGEHSAMVALSGVAGGATLGARVFLMAQSGVGGHVHVGDGVFVGARGGVLEDLPAGSRVWGFPALPERSWHRAQAVFARAGEMLRRLRRLEMRNKTGGGDGDNNVGGGGGGA